MKCFGYWWSCCAGSVDVVRDEGAVCGWPEVDRLGGVACVGVPAAQPQYDLRFGWERLFALGLLAREASSGLFLLAGEGPDSFERGVQVTGIGDVDVVLYRQL
jgi:hypothetical protein